MKLDEGGKIFYCSSILQTLRVSYSIKLTDPVIGFQLWELVQNGPTKEEIFCLLSIVHLKCSAAYL